MEEKKNGLVGALPPPSCPAPPLPQEEDDEREEDGDERGYEQHGDAEGGGFFLDDVDDALLGAVDLSGGGRNDGASARDGCEACGCGQYDTRFHSAFGLRVCFACTRADRKYALLSATEAKSRFALTDGDLRTARLPRLVKAKTTHRADGEVHLYCATQVLSVALSKHGSGEAIEQAVQTRLDASLARREAKKRTQAALEDGGDDGAVARSAAPRARKKPAAGAAAAAAASAKPHAARRQAGVGSEPGAHAHVYTRPPVFDADAGCHVRTCDTCGASECVEIM